MNREVIERLSGDALDRAVAHRLGMGGTEFDRLFIPMTKPTIDGTQCLIIMEQHGIGVAQYNNADNKENRWIATKYIGGMLVGIKQPPFAFGSTINEAAMRCFLISTMGNDHE